MQPKRSRAALEDDEGIADHAVLDATGEWVPCEPPAQPASPAQQQRQAGTLADAVAAALGDQQADEPGVPAPDAGTEDSDSSAYYSDDSDDGQPSMQRSERMLMDQSGIRLLEVHADKRQGVYLVPYRQPGQRNWRHAFMGFRSLRFSNGAKLLGYSRGCLCASDAGSDQHAAREGRDRPGVPRAWLTGDAMCSCSRQLLQHLGGESSMLRVFSMSPAASDGSTAQAVRLRGEQYYAVRVGPEFYGWGIVDSKGRCCSCASRQHICEHVQKLPDSAQAAQQPPLSAVEFYAKQKADSGI